MQTSQMHPPGVKLERPKITYDEAFEKRDPKLYKACEEVIAGLKNDIIPQDVQEQLFHSMNGATQRTLVTQASGLDASILMTFKQQLQLVDAILRRTFNPDGSISSSWDDGMEPKDVLNMSFKVNQTMTRDLPKVYNMERIQRMEAALMEVMSRKLTREQQDEFIKELEGLHSTV